MLIICTSLSCSGLMGYALVAQSTKLHDTPPASNKAHGDNIWKAQVSISHCLANYMPIQSCQFSAPVYGVQHSQATPQSCAALNDATLCLPVTKHMALTCGRGSSQYLLVCLHSLAPSCVNYLHRSIVSSTHRPYLSHT